MATINSLKPRLQRNDTNNVYYNIKITNDGSELYKLANYSVNRTSAIVENPSEYELAVVRFSVPSSNIPVMRWGTDPYDPDSNPSSKIDRMFVTLSFDGVDVTKTLIYIPNSLEPPSYGPSIWNYQHFVDILNVALKDAFTDLKALKPLAPPTTAPYVTYDSVPLLCSLFAPQTYDTGNPTDTVPPPPTIQIYFNTYLYRYFPSLEVYKLPDTSEPKTFQILVKNTSNNAVTISGTPYYEMKQEYSTVALWNDFNTILFETDTIPVEPEFEPTQNDTTRRIITDFEPLDEINNREKFQYYGAGWKRYYDLKSTYPLKNIDMRVYWEDKIGRTYPVVIGADEAITVKLLFRKKLPLVLEQSLYPED
jgi:hypothetical protein